MRDPAVRSAHVIARRSRRHQHAERPARCRASRSPSTSAPWPRRTRQRRPTSDVSAGAAAPAPFGEHRDERAGIRELHRAIDVAGGLDRAERAQRAIVARRRARPRSPSSSRRSTRRRRSRRSSLRTGDVPGKARSCGAAATAPARGDQRRPAPPTAPRPTSRRSARLKRHLAANSRRRARGQADVRAARSVRRAPPAPTCAASSPPRTREAQAVAGHRIDEARPRRRRAAGPARRRRGASTASGPSTTGADVIRAPAKRSRSSDRRRSRSSAPPRCDRGARSREPPRRRGHDHEQTLAQPARHRRDAEVAAAAHVHLAERRHAGDVLEVGADRPAARARADGAPGRAAARARERRPSAAMTSGAGTRTSRAVAAGDDDAADARPPARHRAAARAPARLPRSARRPPTAPRDQRRVEHRGAAIASPRTPSPYARGRARRAPRSRSCRRPAAPRLERRRQVEAPQDRQRAGIDACRRTACRAESARDRAAARARRRARAPSPRPTRPARAADDHVEHRTTRPDRSRRNSPTPDRSESYGVATSDARSRALGVA